MPLLKHGLKCFTNIYEGNLCVLTFLWDSLITPLLKMMKFMCREVKWCALGYAMSQWPSRKLKPEVLAPQTQPGCVTTTQLITQSLTQPTSCCASFMPGVPRRVQTQQNIGSLYGRRGAASSVARRSPRTRSAPTPPCRAGHLAARFGGGPAHDQRRVGNGEQGEMRCSPVVLPLARPTPSN